MFCCRNARNNKKAEFKTTAWVHVGQEASAITTCKKKLLNWKAWSQREIVPELSSYGMEFIPSFFGMYNTTTG